MYKKLALKLHPDCGGSDDAMAELNNEYDNLFDQLKNTHKNKDGQTYTKETSETPDQFKDIINKLFALKMEGIEIESLFDKKDFPNYLTYAPKDCPECQKGIRLDAIVNSFGYSKF